MIVQLPSGQRLEFPDGMSQAEMAAAIDAMPPEMLQQAKAPTAEKPQDDYMTRENLMTGNPIKDAAIGLGRFATEVGQGVKQMGLKAFGDEGQAEQYTQQINADRERYEKGTQGAGMEDVGYYGGMLAPSLLAPQVGVLGTAGMAGVESGLLPTESGDWVDKLKQVGTGAAFAGALRSMPEAWAAFSQWRKTKGSANVDADVAAFAEQFGIKVPRSVHSPSKSGTIAEEVGQLPVIGRIGAQGMRDDAEQAIRQVADQNAGGGTAQDAFLAGKKGMEDANSEVWKATHRVIGDAPIDREALNNGMQNIYAGLQDTTIGKSMAEEIGSVWKPMREPPPFKGKTMEDWNNYQNMRKEMSKIRGFEGDTLEDLHKFRAQFGAANQAAWAEKGWDVDVPKKIYALLTDELEQAASRSYGKKGTDLFQQAVDQTKQMHRTMDNTRVLDKARKDLIDSETTFVKAAIGNDPDRMKAMSTILGESGAEPIRREIANNILQTYKADGAKAGAKKIRKMDSVINEFFGADEAAAMRGLGKFMDNIPNKKQSLIRTALSGGGVVAGVHMSLPAMIAGASMLPKWLRRTDVTAMLQKLETAPRDSKLYEALTSELAESLAVGLGVEQSRTNVPEIEIRNGVSGDK